MRRTITENARAPIVLIAALIALSACQDEAAETARSEKPPAVSAQPAPQGFEPITIKHALGETLIAKRPQRVAALDMNEVDFLDQLGEPVAGTAKDYVPAFLSKYRDDPAVRDLGSIIKPNLESVHALKPDLVLITSLQADQYKELSGIAPTLHFDVDYRNSQSRHIGVIKEHLTALGHVFGKQDVARQRVAELESKLEEVRSVTRDRPEKALVVMHNNGAFASFGVQSRYGFVFDAMGVTPASTVAETGLHGQPISSEFIQQANPDIIYLIDRTAVMERRPVMTAEGLANPLLRQTNAWKTGRVIFVDADAWYITAASVTSLKIMADDVMRGYRR